MPGTGVLAGEHEVVVACGGAEHVVRWVASEDRLQLLGHPGDRDDDDVLVALSGAPARCRAIEEAWDGLTPSGADQLLAATSSQLASMAARARFTAEQRANVARRDDLSDAERRRLLRAFEELLFTAEVAALGPAFARARAAAVLGPPWRRRLRSLRRRLAGHGHGRRSSTP